MWKAIDEDEGHTKIKSQSEQPGSDKFDKAAEPTRSVLIENPNIISHKGEDNSDSIGRNRRCQGHVQESKEANPANHIDDGGQSAEKKILHGFIIPSPDNERFNFFHIITLA